MSEFRRRYLGPVLLPLSAAVFIGGVAWGFSRMLLSTTEAVAPMLALMAALAVLVTCAFVASKGMAKALQVPLIAAFVLVVAGGSVFAATIGIRPIEAKLPAPNVTVTAHNPLGFDQKQLTIAEIKPTLVVRFDNQDAGSGQPHNWTLAKSKAQASTVLVPGGTPFKGVSSRDYVLKDFAPGAYYYFCEVHPTSMFGVLLLGNAKPPAPEAPSAPAKATVPPPPQGPKVGTGSLTARVVAKNIQYDTGHLALRASATDTITFVNQDSGTPHNIAIASDDQFQHVVFRPNGFVTGPATAKYTFTGPPPGEYFFHCDVHPTMKGTVTFS